MKSHAIDAYPSKLLNEVIEDIEYMQPQLFILNDAGSSIISKVTNHYITKYPVLKDSLSKLKIINYNDDNQLETQLIAEFKNIKNDEVLPVIVILQCNGSDHAEPYLITKQNDVNCLTSLSSTMAFVNDNDEKLSQSPNITTMKMARLTHHTDLKLWKSQRDLVSCFPLSLMMLIRILKNSNAY